MADRVSIPPAEVLLSKRVQEMVLTGEDPLGPYVYSSALTDQTKEEEDTESSESALIPSIVDLRYFFPENCCSEESSYTHELEKLNRALSTWGCFQAIGHGISRSLLEDVRGVGREFFKQPMEEKNKYAKPVTEFQGYGADPVPAQGQPLDWSDRIFLVLVPKDQRDYKFWPEKPSSFKKVLEEYTEKIQNLTDVISKSMARSLGVEENCFAKQFGERAELQGRFNYYSPCKKADAVLGLKAHADGSGYTIITEDKPGLQILKDGKWYTVCYTNPDAVLVLMGDQMETSQQRMISFAISFSGKFKIMSNGIFKSPVHRVIADPERDRVSVAVFYYPETGKEVEPEESLINAETPIAFNKVKDYANLHMEYYNRGIRALHLVRV